MRWIRLGIQSAAAILFLFLALFYLLPIFNLEAILGFFRELGLVGFYAGFVLLTLVGIPSTPFYLLGGAVFPLWQNLLGVAVAIVLHFAIAYWLSHKVLRKPIRRFLDRRGIRLPEVRPDNEMRVTLLVKFAPGFPMFLKSYILGVAGVSFRVFMVVSCFSTFVFATAFLTLGRSAMEGSTGFLLGGIAILIFATALLRVIRRRARSAELEGEELL